MAGPGMLRAAVLILLVSLPLVAAGKDKGGDLVQVRAEGASAFPAKEILESVGISRGVGQALLRRPPRARRGDLEAAAEAVRLFYQRHGYFEAAVAHGTAKDGAAVFTITEGPPCRVQSVVLTLAEGTPSADANPDELGRDLPIREGQTFSAEIYEATEGALLSRMREDGHAFAGVSPEAVVDLAAHSATITFTLAPGARYTVGKIEFRGIKEGEEKLFRRILAFAPGDLYRQSKIEETRDRLYKLGLFESVAFVPKEGETPGTVNLRIRLKEGRPHRVRLGLGYGTEDQLRGQVRWETLRFAGRAMVLGAEAKASSIDNRIDMYLRRPYFYDVKTTLLSSATFGKKVESDFDYTYLKAQAGLQRDFLPGDRLQGSAFVVAERVLQFAPDQTLDDAIKGGAREVATMTSVAVTLTTRTTDDFLDPSRGVMANLYVEPTRVLEGGTSFTKTMVEGRWYASLKPDWTLGLKLKAGDIIADHPAHVPLTRRFYAGGANSIRGYAYNSLGPLSSQGALLGGDGLLEASAELRFPLKGSLKGLAFVDAGNALPKAFKFPKDWLRAGTGLGIRYQTPVGPLGLDIAWPLKHDPRNPSPYQIYFFIGYAF